MPSIMGQPLIFLIFGNHEINSKWRMLIIEWIIPFGFIHYHKFLSKNDIAFAYRGKCNAFNDASTSKFPYISESLNKFWIKNWSLIGIDHYTSCTIKFYSLSLISVQEWYRICLSWKVQCLQWCVNLRFSSYFRIVKRIQNEESTFCWHWHHYAMTFCQTSTTQMTKWQKIKL